jgi:hypothetical protein
MPDPKRMLVTPGLRMCEPRFAVRRGARFTDEDLSDEGNAFAKSYFDFQSSKYLNDYCNALGISIHRIYYAADTWENFNRLKPVLDRRYAEWKNKRA